MLHDTLVPVITVVYPVSHSGHTPVVLLQFLIQLEVIQGTLGMMHCPDVADSV